MQDEIGSQAVNITVEDPEVRGWEKVTVGTLETSFDGGYGPVDRLQNGLFSSIPFEGLTFEPRDPRTLPSCSILLPPSQSWGRRDSQDSGSPGQDLRDLSYRDPA